MDHLRIESTRTGPCLTQHSSCGHCCRFTRGRNVLRCSFLWWFFTLWLMRGTDCGLYCTCLCLDKQQICGVCTVFVCWTLLIVWPTFWIIRLRIKEHKFSLPFRNKSLILHISYYVVQSANQSKCWAELFRTGEISLRAELWSDLQSSLSADHLSSPLAMAIPSLPAAPQSSSPAATKSARRSRLSPACRPLLNQVCRLLQSQVRGLPLAQSRWLWLPRARRPRGYQRRRPRHTQTRRRPCLTQAQF